MGKMRVFYHISVSSCESKPSKRSKRLDLAKDGIKAFADVLDEKAENAAAVPLQKLLDDDGFVDDDTREFLSPVLLRACFGEWVRFRAAQ